MRIVVLGGGILGLSIGYNLAIRGAQVQVIEGGYPGSGFSVRGIGIVHSQWENELDIKLAKRSRELLEHLSIDLNFNIPFRQNGCLMLATDESELAQLKESARKQELQRIDTRFMSKAEISTRYPYLDTSTLVGGTFSKEDGVVHPFSVVFGYWHALERYGGKLLRSTIVKGLKVRGNAIRAVETDRATYEADATVITTGLGTSDALRSVGIHVPTALVKHEMLATEPLKFFLKPAIQIQPNRISVIQSLRGEVICEMPREEQEQGDDRSSTLEFLEDAASELVHLIPALRKVRVLRPWAGMVESTRERRPIFDKMNYENLWVVFADSSKGVMFAPAIGELISKAIVTEASNVNPLSESSGKLLAEANVS